MRKLTTLTGAPIGGVSEVLSSVSRRAPTRAVVFLPLILTTALIAGCDSGTLVTGTASGDDIYELELDNEIGPLDDGNSESEPLAYIPGDYEIDSDGVIVEEPQIGAALPARAIRKQEGAWTRVFNWPVSPIHMAMMPDNTVLTYGTNPDAQNATAFTFDKWMRWRGKGANSHETAPTGIETNLFCSAQSVMPDGNVLISGGDGNQVDDQTLKNDGIDATTFFDYRSNILTNGPSMVFPRWYPTLLTLPDGRQLVLGGREYRNKTASGATEVSIPPVPEVFDPSSGQWQVLPGATNQAFFNRVWYYPRSWVRHNGNVVIADHKQDRLVELSVDDGGSLTNLGRFPGSFGAPNSPAAMFQPGKILFVSTNKRAEVLDINGDQVSVERTSPTTIARKHANATILANGEVFLSGGIATGAATNSGDFPGEIWNPDSGEWSLTAKARKARLYHSTAMLMPNGRVLVAGGGPPGPVINMNAEIFIPPYLFNANGRFATRPLINTVGDIDYGNQFNATVTSETPISKVSFVRAGSVTHSYDMGQRYMELDFDQTGNTLDITAPANPNVAPPGLYMLFVFNQAGVPAHAKLILLGEGQDMISLADPGF
jgi:hypothetical protein